MKRKRKQKKGQLCYIHMKEPELWLYSPQFHQTKEEAMKVLMDDCRDIAEHNGYTEDQIFMPGVGELMNKIDWIWDNYDRIMKEASDEESN